MEKALLHTLKQKANEIRKLTIQEIGQLTVGHIGGTCDLCELLSVLYFHAMRIDPAQPDLRERDRFVLSKGHGGPALYATLALRGYFPLEELNTLNQPGTNLPSHCDMNRTRGIDMTTGSLGQGFSCAVGMAVAAQRDGLPSYIYTCIGDGESQEGQVWEAAMFVAHYGLNNLCAFVDFNGLQIDGAVTEVMNPTPLDTKFAAFGWNTLVIDGHDFDQIASAVEAAKRSAKPTAVICKTTKGKGVSYMENVCAWHGSAPKTEQYEQGMRELEEAEKALLANV